MHSIQHWNPRSLQSAIALITFGSERTGLPPPPWKFLSGLFSGFVSEPMQLRVTAE